MKTSLVFALSSAALLVSGVSERAARASLLPYCEPVESRDSDPREMSPLCPDVLERTPSWKKPSVNAPPLAVADAIRAAHAEVRRASPEVEEWELLEVGLHSTRVEHKWYYTVRWRPTQWRTQEDQRTRTIVVLMDGRAV